MRLLWGIAALLLWAPVAEARTWTVGEATVRAAGGQVTVRAGGLTARLAAQGPFTAVRRAVHQRFRTPAGKRRRHALDARLLTLGADDRRVEVLVARDGFAIRGRGVGAPRYDAPGATAWLQRYVSHYEAPYAPTALDQAHGEYGYPALVRTATGWALLTEAGLSDDGAARLVARDGTLRVGHATIRGMSPWRLAVLGGIDDVVGTDLPLALGGRARIGQGWIRPGRVAWSWWSDSTSPARLETQQAYVDAAAARGWEYVLVDEGWDAAWVPRLVEYARERDVGILLWTHWRALREPARRARLLKRWAGWGVAGVKADFLQSDSRSRLNAYVAIARAAARRRLVVNFHGSTLSRGLQRTWPNVLTGEAVLGAEHAKQTALPAAHDVNLVFTRNAVGSMDYTPVTFAAGANEAHQLALAVAFESGLQHFADTPDAYAARPAVDAVLRAVPAAWDDTRLLAGAPDSHATIARRAGDEWWVADVSAGAAATRTVPLAFLDPGRTYTATLVTEGLRTSTRTVTAADTLTVPVAADGGFTLRLTP